MMSRSRLLTIVNWLVVLQFVVQPILAVVPPPRVALAAPVPEAALELEAAQPAEEAPPRAAAAPDPRVQTATVPLPVSNKAADSDSRAGIAIAQATSTAPLMFVENVGQFDEEARFQARGGGATLHLTDDALWYTVLDCPEPEAELSEAPDALDPLAEDRVCEGVNLRVSFGGANPNAHIEPFDRLDTSVNYFIGNDPDEWHTDVPVWGGVRYVDLYPGVDLEIRSSGGRKSQWLVASMDADLRPVRMRVEGADGMTVDEDGLHVATAVGDFSLPLLAVDATTAERSLPANTGPAVHGDVVTSPFNVIQGGAAKLHALPLADTSEDLLYATYLGGSGTDPYYRSAIAVDSGGAAYVTGYVMYDGFPTVPGSYDTQFDGSSDAFVAKLSADGSDLVYSTFLGGTSSEESDGITVDDGGAAHVVGTTYSSTTFPTKQAFDSSFNGASDAFVTVLNPEGNDLTYSTFLGGSSYDDAHNVAVDNAGVIYVTGSTNSNNFPTFGAYPDGTLGGTGDAFATILIPDGSDPIYSTYLGGGDSDYADGITVDGNGMVYVGGSTKSADFFSGLEGGWDDSLGGARDAFVIKLDPNNSTPVYFTYLGGDTDEEYGRDIAVDASGSAWITGRTESTDFPLKEEYDGSLNGQRDGFVTKFNADGSDLIYSTYLGGEGNDYARGIVVDDSGAAIVAGGTGSSDFPVTHGTPDESGGAFVTKLIPDGSDPPYSTVLAGASGHGIQLDQDGAAYIVGSASDGFVTTPGAYQEEFGGGSSDLFVAKLSLIVPGATNAVPDDTVAGFGKGGSCPAEILYTNDGRTNDPINTKTGNVLHHESDIALATECAGLHFSRSYSSFNARDVHEGDLDSGDLSPGWTHNFEVRLIFEPDRVLIHAADGARAGFSEVSDGVYAAEEGIGGTLTREGSGSGVPETTRGGVNSGAQMTGTSYQGAGSFNALGGAGSSATYQGRGVTAFVRGLTGEPSGGEGYTYTYHNSQGVGYTFDSDGRLTSIFDAKGETLTLEYDPGTGLLAKVEEENEQRYLVFGYDEYETDKYRLYRVGDHTVDDINAPTPTERYVEYGYTDVAGGGFNLTSFRDLRGKYWYYSYVDDSNQTYMDGIPAGMEYLYHYLYARREATNGPTGTPEVLPVVVKFEYDDESLYEGDGGNSYVQALEEHNGAGEIVAALTYNTGDDSDDTAVENGVGNVDTHEYDSDRKTLSGESDPAGGTSTDYDVNFRPIEVFDANGNPTAMAWSADGANLESVEDALDNETTFEYNAANRPTLITSAVETPAETKTFFIYNTEFYENPDTGLPVSNPDWNEDLDPDLLLKQIENYVDGDNQTGSDDEDLITSYEYTLDSPPEPDNLLRSVTSPDGVKTCYEYNRFAQVTATYENCDDMDPNTGEDDADIKTSTTYDLVGRVIEQTVAEDDPEVERTTRFIYHDGDGRADEVITNYDDAKDPYEDGLYNLSTRTFTDASGRVVATVQNYRDTDIDEEECPGLPEGMDLDGDSQYDDATLEICPDRPDYNRITLTDYDAAGRVSMTKTAAWPAQGKGDYYTVERQDGTKSTYNLVSSTFYDAASRVVATIDNYNTDIAEVDCTGSPEGLDLDGDGQYDDATLEICPEHPEYNRITLTEYDAADRVSTTTRAAWPAQGKGSYEPVERADGIVVYYNLVTAYEYDAAGNVLKTVTNFDPVTSPQNGDIPVWIDSGANEPEWVRLDGNEGDKNQMTCAQYDALNRSEFVRTACRPPLAYDSGTPNPWEETGYAGYLEDLAGATFSDYDDTVGDNLYNLVTRTVYDEMGRAIASIRNYNEEGGTVSDEEIILVLDTEYNFITRTYYDGLGRVEYTVTNFAEVDGYHDGDIFNPDPPPYDSDTPDRNLVTRTYYDWTGRQIATVRNYFDDTGGDLTQADIEDGLPDLNLVTRTYYDDRGLVDDVVENFAGLISNPTPEAFDPDFPDRNLRTDYEYDELGRRIETTTDRDAAGSRTNQTAYDELGRVEEQIANYVNGGSVEPDEDLITSFTYDLLGRTLETTDPESRVRETVYDALGRAAQQIVDPDGLALTTTFTYDVAGQTVEVTDGEGGVSATAYDPLGRALKSTQDPGGLDITEQTTYDLLGRVVTETDGEGFETAFTYDNLGRLVAVQENAGGSCGPDRPCTTYTYDKAGNRTETTLENDTFTAYEYDALGRLTREAVDEYDPDTNPDGIDIVTEHVYDAAGNQVELVRDPGGGAEQTTTYTYDALGRVLDVDYPSGTPDVTYTYDSFGNRDTMSDGTGIQDWDYTYDDVNRLWSVEDSSGQTISYEYTKAGDRKTLDVPGLSQIDYTYDNAHRLDTVSDPFAGGGAVIDYAFDDADRLTGVTLPNGITTTYGYDPADRLLSLVHETATDPRASFSYTLDDRGFRTDAAETLLAPAGGGGGAMLPGGSALVLGESPALGHSLTTTSGFSLPFAQGEDPLPDTEPSAPPDETETIEAPTATATPDEQPADEPTPTEEPTPPPSDEPTPTETPTADGSPTPVPSEEPTDTPTGTDVPTGEPTDTPTSTPTETPSPTPTPDAATAEGGLTFTVTSTGDGGDGDLADGLCDDGSGACTLRAAIEQANASEGADTIVFDLPGEGPHTIEPASPLPAISDPLTLDGGGVVELDGRDAGPYANGLTLTAGGSTVRGLIINRFERHGIVLQGAGGNLIEDNLVGTNAAGTHARGNLIGVLVEGSPDNTIRGNLLSGNHYGVYLHGEDAARNVVQDNRVGTDAAGREALYNWHGVHLKNAPDNVVEGNLISGNQVGVYLTGKKATGNQVQGNRIGTDRDGKDALPNEQAGIHLHDAPGNKIGGAGEKAGNLIAGGEIGIDIRGSNASANRVKGNTIGTKALDEPEIGLRITNAPDTVIENNAIFANREGIASKGPGATGTQLEDNQIEVDGALPPEPDQDDSTPGEPVTGALGAAISGSSGLSLDSEGLFAPLAQGTTFTVDSTGDGGDSNTGDGVCNDGSGACTLRAAIEEANAYAGADTVDFDIDGSGPHTIQPASGLPTVTEALTIDGTTDPDAIELDGVNAGAGAIGLSISAGDSTVRGLVINRFDGQGIFLEDEGGNVIENNLIGTDTTGATARPNGIGVWIWDSPGNTVGGTGANEGNLISGNDDQGLEISSSGNEVLGNFIGTDVTGTAALPNGGAGILIDGGASGNTVGGTSAAARNVISGNGDTGLTLYGSSTSGNEVLGNFVGTDANGTAAIPNTSYGLHVAGAPTNTIGGTDPGAGNLISGNGDNGLTICGSSTSGNQVQGNFVGTDLNGTAALPNSGTGVTIWEAPGNTIGGTDADAGNLISGNTLDGIVVNQSTATGNVIQGNTIGADVTGAAALPNGDEGVQIHSPDTTVGGTDPNAGNLISGNTGTGLYVGGGASGTVVQGNTIGADASGTAALPNDMGGIIIWEAPGNTIGGTDANAGNLISGNGYNGLYIGSSGASGNVVLGNTIGADATGTVALGNADTGVYITGAPGNTVGGTSAAARNLLSGNGGNGLLIVGVEASGNQVLGNFVGTDANGTAALPNGGRGLYLSRALNNTIGGTDPGAGNLFSGNASSGILINGVEASGNQVLGNFVGTDVNGTAALPNGGMGINIWEATGNTIGGADPDAGNLISGNSQDGIVVTQPTATGNVIQGNTIGADVTGTAALPNGDRGMRIHSADTTVSGNTVAFNTGRGVYLSGATAVDNTLSANAIHDNGGIGIDLGGDGVTANDPDDPDTGTNNLQNYPVLSAATSDGVSSTTVEGALDSTPSTAFTVEFFSSPEADPSGYGEGAVYLGSEPVATDVNGDATISAVLPVAVADGHVVTATATDPDGNTSEFSAPVTVVVVYEDQEYDWHYQYDGLGRLLYACSDWDDVGETCLGDEFTFTYDGAGNLLTMSRWDETGQQVETVAYIYNGANQVACEDLDLSETCEQNEEWDYDDYGNLIDDKTNTYTYDAANRLISVTDGVSTSTFEYNGDGDRISQTVDSVETTYLLDTAVGLTRVLSETTGEDTIYYLHGLGLVAESDGVSTDYFLNDGLGSVRQLTNAAATPLLAQTFDPYGNLYASAGVGQTAYGFTGEYTDASGLLYLRARYYNPAQGRFLNMDPSRQELNPYQYSLSNPVMFIDPSGTVVKVVCGPFCQLFGDETLPPFLLETALTGNPVAYVVIFVVGGYLIIYPEVEVPEVDVDIVAVCEAYVNALFEQYEQDDPDPDPEPQPYPLYRPEGDPTKIEPDEDDQKVYIAIGWTAEDKPPYRELLRPFAEKMADRLNEPVIPFWDWEGIDTESNPFVNDYELFRTIFNGLMYNEDVKGILANLEGLEDDDLAGWIEEEGKPPSPSNFFAIELYEIRHGAWCSSSDLSDRLHFYQDGSTSPWLDTDAKDEICE